MDQDNPVIAITRPRIQYWSRRAKVYLFWANAGLDTHSCRNAEAPPLETCQKQEGSPLETCRNRRVLCV